MTLKNFHVVIFVCFVLQALVSIASFIFFGRTPLLATSFALLSAVILSVIIIREFAVPIVRLSRIARKIAEGEFPQNILRKSRFEVGKLEEAVEKMSHDLDRMFRKLSAERGRVAAILSSMTEAVIAVDREERIILINPAAEKSFSLFQPEVQGKTVREGVHNNEIAELIEESRESGSLIEKEISIVTPIQAAFAATAGPIRSPEGGVLGVVCVLHDITELKKLENYRTEFVANVSHELKTPLTAMRNYVETLLGGAIDDREHNLDFLRKIEKHSVNLSALIDDILEISRLESKREVGAFTRLDVAKVFHRALETITGKAKKKGIEFIAQCPEESIFIMGIEDHVYRAFLNLLDNAVNYTDPGGKVTVTCARHEGKIEITVADTGIGIPAEHLPRIFERFYRVDKARSRELGGTGLGLAIVKHVMNLHNGSVSVESEESKGSKFTLTFPLA